MNMRFTLWREAGHPHRLLIKSKNVDITTITLYE
jgi:hypothetical protein